MRVVNNVQKLTKMGLFQTEYQLFQCNLVPQVRTILKEILRPLFMMAVHCRLNNQLMNKIRWLVLKLKKKKLMNA